MSFALGVAAFAIGSGAASAVIGVAQGRDSWHNVAAWVLLDLLVQVAKAVTA